MVDVVRYQVSRFFEAISSFILYRNEGLRVARIICVSSRTEPVSWARSAVSRRMR